MTKIRHFLKSRLKRYCYRHIIEQRLYKTADEEALVEKVKNAIN